MIYYKGEPIFIDTGRNTYYFSDKRIYYRGPFAHNVAVIDEGCEWRTKDNWRFPEYPCSLKNNVESNSFLWCFQTEYRFESKNLKMKRYTLVYEGFVIILTTSFCQGLHKLSSFWHLNEKLIVDESAKCIKDLNLNFAFTGDLSVEKSWISYRYNDEVQSSCMRIDSLFNDLGWQVLCLSAQNIFVKEIDNGHFCVCQGKTNNILMEVFVGNVDIQFILKKRNGYL